MKALRRQGADESGMATAEFAVALPAVIVVLTLVVAVAQLLLTQHRAWQSASVAARVAARGGGENEVRQAVNAAGLPADVALSRDASWVSATVTAHPSMPFGWALPDVTARAVAADENAVASAGDGG